MAADRREAPGSLTLVEREALKLAVGALTAHAGDQSLPTPVRDCFAASASVLTDMLRTDGPVRR